MSAEKQNLLFHVKILQDDSCAMEAETHLLKKFEEMPTRDKSHHLHSIKFSFPADCESLILTLTVNKNGISSSQDRSVRASFKIQ